MSLINDALKAVQSQAGKPKGIIPIPVALLKEKKNKFYLSYIVMVILIISSICLIGYSLINLMKDHNITYVRSSLNQIEYDNQSVAMANDDNVIPAKIKGVSINVRDNITEIIFSLSHPVLYYVSSDPLSNRINIAFDNTEIISTIPDLNMLQTSFSSIEYRNTKDKAIFSLTLLPNTKIHYLHESDDKDHPEFILAIESGLIQKAMNSNMATPVVYYNEDNLVEEEYIRIMNELKGGNKQVNLDNLRKFIEQHPMYHKARVAYAAFLINNGKLDLAMQIVDEGISIKKDYLPYIELKARIYMLRDESKLGLALLDKYSPNLANNQRFYELKAVLYHEVEKYDDAIKMYQALLVLDPSHVDWWVGLGGAFEKIKSTFNAEAAYREAMLFNTNSELNIYLAKRLSILGGDHANT